VGVIMRRVFPALVLACMGGCRAAPAVRWPGPAAAVDPTPPVQSRPATVVARAAAPAASATSVPEPAATPSAPPSPVVDVCKDGALEACAAACKTAGGDACEAFGARVCVEGSLVECNVACDGGTFAACDALAGQYDNGMGRVGEDVEKAVALYERGCAAGRRKSCEAAGFAALHLADYDEEHLDVGGAEQAKAMHARALADFDAGCDRARPEVGWRRGLECACSKLEEEAGERIWPAIKAACEERGALCEEVSYSRFATPEDRAVALGKLCAADMHSAACGKLRDLAAATDKH
jgi:hypothetical protein